jgi:hypothetical protein
MLRQREAKHSKSGVNEMRRLVISLAMICLLALPIAFAATSNVKEVKTAASSRNLVDGAIIGSTQTVTKTVAGFTKLIEFIEVTDTDDDGDIVLTKTCTGSIDGTNYGSITTSSVSSGVRTLNVLTETFAFTAASSGQGIIVQSDIWGFSSYKCSYSFSGGDNEDDTYTVQWNLVQGK